ncbi:hypothetical protein SDC9_210343 [bioreactor metagenome]|uniref:Uncharacterized protein n=1 Tax=bioreactor metagenome TaxID=1076179 RepID=A0A645JH94_9ZZZZ
MSGYIAQTYRHREIAFYEHQRTDKRRRIIAVPRTAFLQFGYALKDEKKKPASQLRNVFMGLFLKLENLIQPAYGPCIMSKVDHPCMLIKRRAVPEDNITRLNPSKIYLVV